MGRTRTNIGSSKETIRYTGTCMMCGATEQTTDEYPRIICKACKRSDSYQSASMLAENMLAADLAEE